MALRSIVTEDVEPAGPTPEEQLAAERAEAARREAAFAERQAAMEGRLEQMERMGRRAATPQPMMTPQQAQMELGLSADDIANDPEKALRALTDHIRQSTKAELTREYAPVIQGLAAQAFQGEREGLKSRKYWAAAEKDFNRYFEDNPQEALTPGRAKEVYDYLVGRNIEQYEAAIATQDEKDKAFTRERLAATSTSHSTAEPPMRRSSAEPRPKADDDFAPLSEEEELVRQKYNAYGANISQREWRLISEGKVIPKTANSSDWQAGWGDKSRRKVRGMDY